MNTLFLCIVVFLIVLAIFDLVVGVSNDAVNFLNSAIGAKVARYRTIVIIASIGVFAGASLSNGMLDVARHGIMMPEFYSFYDVMCIFMAVMLTDVLLLDVFNSLGMPTSTTVSMVFELLGGAFCIALIKIMQGATDATGNVLSLGNLINTEKAMSVIMGIFLSVAIAFLLGFLTQWLARVIFTFNGKSCLKNGIFGGIAITSIMWFMLVGGLKGSTLMTPELKNFVDENTCMILGGGIILMSLVMTALSYAGLNIMKTVVLAGTFALAMAFAGNDLVNFVGVPLTGLDAYQDYMANGNANPNGFLMVSLMKSAHTPIIYLVLAGIIMVLALVFSPKAKNVVKTSVDLSRQDEGEEMFGSSAVARTLVRSVMVCSKAVGNLIPVSVNHWIDSRFNTDQAVLPNGAAFDQVRAAVNLVLAGLLVATGTRFKLPLSTTYVTFMVAMGTSLADRAWSRQSAVFRITGVLSVIGGWFITAGVAFIVTYLIACVMYVGHFPAMAIGIVLALFMLIRSNLRQAKKTAGEQQDMLFAQIMRSHDENLNWNLLVRHVSQYSRQHLAFIMECYQQVTDAFFREEYRPLKKAVSRIEEQRNQLKRQRCKEVLALRRVNHFLSIERDTWYFLAIGSISQMLYCLKRIVEPCREHIGNNFASVSSEYSMPFKAYQQEIIKLFGRMENILSNEGNAIGNDTPDALRADASALQRQLSAYRKTIIYDIQNSPGNLEPMILYLSIVQESQALLSDLRHLARGYAKFSEEKNFSKRGA
ncbi:MAG: anion permease [Bacteroidaceae bacterium]